MRSSTLLLTTATILLDTASAHGYVTGVNVKGTFTKGSDPVWWYYDQNKQPRPLTAGWDALNQDNGFVEPAALGTADINCHKSATAGKLYASVNAGDTIDFKWSGWPDSHKGPIINYIAPCAGDCTAIPSTSLRWTKISQTAITSTSPVTWITDNLIKNNFTVSTTIPRNLAPGNYVIRHEIIALHGGQNDNGAQLYPQCLNLKVSGSGSVVPTGGVAGTALYKRDEKGIVYNLYTGQTVYTFPGPAVWTGAN